MSRSSVELGLVGVLAVLAGWSFTVVFVLADLAPVVIAAAVVATAVAVVAATVGAGVAVSIGAQVVALAAGSVVLLRGATDRSVEALVGAVVDGPARIATVAVPAPADPELLVVPFVGVGLACAAGCEMARRTSASLAPALPPVLLLAASQVFVLPSTPRSSGPVWAFVVVAATLAAVRHAGSERGRPADDDQESHQGSGPHGSTAAQVTAVRRRSSVAVVGAVVLLAVVTVGAASLPMVTAREPMSLRGYFAEPPRSPVVDNPLGSIAAEHLDDPDVPGDRRLEEVLTLEFDDEVPLAVGFGDERRLRVSWVVLDSFDGARWRATTTFDPVARELPPPLEAAPEERPAVSGTATINQLDGPWLPMVGRASEVSFLEGGRSLLVDTVTGTVAVPGTSVAGDDVDVVSYRFTAVPPPGAPLEELGLLPGLPDDGIDWRRLIDTDDELSSLVQRLEQLRDELFLADPPGSIGFVGQLRRVEALFHSQLAERIVEAGIPVDELPRLAEQPFTFLLPPDGVPTAPAGDDGPGGQAELRVPTGHSLEALLQFLGSSPPGREGEVPPHAGDGSPEQFAAAGALLLRSAGIPARVTVGWSVPSSDVTGSTAVVRRHHADAWVEAWSTTHGWVPLDTTPTPQVEQTPLDLENLAPPPADLLDDGQPAEPVVLEEADADLGGGLLASDAWWFPILVVVVVGSVVGVLGPFLVLAARRRRRRRTTSAAASVAAAWDDALEELMGSGLSVTVTMTPAEVVERARHHLGNAPLEQLARLGRVVDQSAHGEEEPTPKVAEAAWYSADRVRRVIRNHASPGRRVLLAIDVRPALRRRRQLQRAERLRSAAAAPSRSPQPVG